MQMKIKHFGESLSSKIIKFKVNNVFLKQKLNRMYCNKKGSAK
jgi:hypothetical protein